MENQRQIFINGAFTSQSMTGVQRYAVEITKRVLQLPARGTEKITVVTPRGQLADFVSRNLWEQVGLCLRTWRGVLFSPSNIGPWFHPRQVVTIHDMRAYSDQHQDSLPYRALQWHRASLKALSKTAKFIVTDSHYSRSAICERLAVPEERVSVIYPGADHVLDFGHDDATLDRLRLQPGGYVLAVGSLYPHKNLQILHGIDWNAYGLKLCIVGEAPKTNAPAFRDMVQEARRQPQSILYTGRLSDSEIRALYTGAFAYVFPSLYEGFGFPPLEAMYCGCPVIASDRTSIPEVCGDAAVYFDALSREALQHAVEKLVGSHALRDLMVRRGYDRVRQFTWDRAAGQVMGVLDRV